MEDYRQKAVTQLGTVGSGNHYVDLMRDEAGFVWIGVHFGSRGLGHTSATRYLKAAGGKDGMNVPPAVIDEDSEIGRRYIAAMELGRALLLRRPRMGDRARPQDHRRRRHRHGAQPPQLRLAREPRRADLWVVRKGATPAFPGQRGFVGGSMGDDAVIIEGVDSEKQGFALFDRPRRRPLFGRKEAKRRFTRKQMDAWLHRARRDADRRRP
jgi:tRNA-splicing ligase RtcB